MRKRNVSAFKNVKKSAGTISDFRSQVVITDFVAVFRATFVLWLIHITSCWMGEGVGRLHYSRHRTKNPWPLACLSLSEGK
jgi:hypothetical protein